MFETERKHARQLVAVLRAFENAEDVLARAEAASSDLAAAEARAARAKEEAARVAAERDEAVAASEAAIAEAEKRQTEAETRAADAEKASAARIAALIETESAAVRKRVADMATTERHSADELRKRIAALEADHAEKLEALTAINKKLEVATAALQAIRERVSV